MMNLLLRKLYVQCVGKGIAQDTGIIVFWAILDYTT